MQTDVHFIDLVKSCPFLNLFFKLKPSSNEFCKRNISVDTAANEPLKVGLVLKLQDSIFADPPRPKKGFLYLTRKYASTVYSFFLDGPRQTFLLVVEGRKLGGGEICHIFPPKTLQDILPL